MSKKIQVQDEYRTNKLSLEQGGHEVTVVMADGARFVYDKVKDPYRYVMSIHRKGKDIQEVYVDGEPFEVDFD